MEKIINEILDEVMEHKNKAMQVDNKAIKPNHYKAGEFDVIAFCQLHNINFDLGNVIKYVTRAGYKDNQLEDLKKAMWYLQREIDRIENK